MKRVPWKILKFCQFRKINARVGSLIFGVFHYYASRKALEKAIMVVNTLTRGEIPADTVETIVDNWATLLDESHLKICHHSNDFLQLDG